MKDRSQYYYPWEYNSEDHLLDHNIRHIISPAFQMALKVIYVLIVVSSHIRPNVKKGQIVGDSSNIAKSIVLTENYIKTDQNRSMVLKSTITLQF